MHKQFHSYTAFSIGCFVVWALIFMVRWFFQLPDSGHIIFYVFCGWLIGWLSGAIARRIYH